MKPPAPTRTEIETVAAAMWNSGRLDGRPLWNQLDERDAALKREMRQQALVGIRVFLNLRQKAAP